MVRTTPAPIVQVTRPSQTINNSGSLNSGSSAHYSNHSDQPLNNSDIKINKLDSQQDDGVVIDSVNSDKQQISKNQVLANKTKESNLVVIDQVAWLPPITHAKIVQQYSNLIKGVDVSGKDGQSILAARDGVVVYAGHGLKGYGNLIILKHENNYLTAYSHNKLNLVKEHTKVKQGQKIAELGKTDSDKPILHFELRKDGKPINPTALFN
jgi:murein DD-endopeptidase MepM/ murein hydrolase activator NlpD